MIGRVATAAWESYLDALTVAVTELEHCLAEGGLPQWSAPPPPDGPPPSATLARRDALLARMVVVVNTVEHRKEELRAQLLALPARSPRSSLTRTGTLGTRLDTCG